jgi:hypothetical protein
MKNTLVNMNLAELEVHDSYTINGGLGLLDVTTWLRKLTPAAAAVYIIDNWEDVKKGISDGWNVE